MNVVFIGASQFGLTCLSSVLDVPDICVTGIVTAPRVFSISYNKEGVDNVWHADVSSVPDVQNIRVFTIDERGMKNDALFEFVQGCEPDMFVVAGWYHMVPKAWRDLAPVYGLHASLLPDYSGGAPLVWAIINGEVETGITMFQFDDGVDSGPIVGQARTPIHENDTIGSLYQRIEGLGRDLLVRYLPDLADGSAILTVQDEAKRRLFPQRRPEDGVIDVTNKARDIYNFVRAQTRPYPGAFIVYDGVKVHVWSAAIVDCSDHSVDSGLFSAGERLFLGCGDGGALEITEISVDDETVEISDFIKNHF